MGARAGRARPGGRARVAVATAAVATLATTTLALDACARAGDASTTDTPDRGADPSVRVVSLVPAASAILDALGAARLVVGRASDDRTAAVASARPVGHVLSPSLETVVALAPDVVVAWPGADLARLREVVEGAHATLLPLRLDRVADVAPACLALGRAVGRLPEAVRLVASIEARLRTVRAASAGVRPARVLWVVWTDPPIAAGPGTHLDDLLHVAGAVNVLADARTPWPRPSIEALVARDPDVVLWPGGAGAPGPADALGTYPWTAVPAVRDRRFVRVEEDLFDGAGPDVARAAATLAVALHPELAADLHTLIVPKGIRP